MNLVVGCEVVERGGDHSCRWRKKWTCEMSKDSENGAKVTSRVEFPVQPLRREHSNIEARVVEGLTFPIFSRLTSSSVKLVDAVAVNVISDVLLADPCAIRFKTCYPVELLPRNDARIRISRDSNEAALMVQKQWEVSVDFCANADG